MAWAVRLGAWADQDAWKKFNQDDPSEANVKSDDFVKNLKGDKFKVW